MTVSAAVALAMPAMFLMALSCTMIFSSEHGAFVSSSSETNENFVHSAAHQGHHKRRHLGDGNDEEEDDDGQQQQSSTVSLEKHLLISTTNSLAKPEEQLLQRHQRHLMNEIGDVEEEENRNDGASSCTIRVKKASIGAGDWDRGSTLRGFGKFVPRDLPATWGHFESFTGKEIHLFLFSPNAL